MVRSILVSGMFVIKVALSVLARGMPMIKETGAHSVSARGIFVIQHAVAL